MNKSQQGLVAAPIFCSSAPASMASSAPASASCSRPSIPPQSWPWRPDPQSLGSPYHAQVLAADANQLDIWIDAVLDAESIEAVFGNPITHSSWQLASH